MKFEAYCDESREELFSRPLGGEGRWVVLGSLWIPADQREAIKADICRCRERHRVHGEFKWHKVSPSRLSFYLDLTSLFFSSNMRFRCLVLPAAELDAAQFHRSDNELMFYKFYYLMLENWILPYNDYRIFLDMKTSRVRGRLAALHRVLSNANLASTISDVQALPSHEVDLLQLSDLLIGAVSYRFHRFSSSPARVALVEAIEEHLGHVIAGTSRGESKFNVFQFAPGGGW